LSQESVQIVQKRTIRYGCRMLKSEFKALLNAEARSPIADMTYLRPDQVPLRYPFSRALVYQWLNDGKIKSVLIPGPGGVRGIRLISVASIEAYLARLAKEQQNEGFIPAVAKEYNTGRKPRPQSATTEQKARKRGRPARRCSHEPGWLRTAGPKTKTPRAA
jgi:hypothetical protein